MLFLSRTFVNEMSMCLEFFKQRKKRNKEFPSSKVFQQEQL